MYNNKKFYAVRKGLTPGVYKTWRECKANVINFPNAEYKSFANESDAHAYLNSNNLSVIPLIADSDVAVAYLGGSYPNKGRKVGYAVTIVGKEKEVDIYWRVLLKPQDDIKMYSGMGEIKAVLKLIDFCEKNGIHFVTVYYGNDAVFSKRNKDVAENGFDLYKQYYSVLINTNVKISFDKLPAYEKHHYKERAEKNAKAGLLLKSEQIRIKNKS